MQVYIWASGLCMEISDVKLIDGCVPSVGDEKKGVPLHDLPHIEPAVWFKVLVLDGVSIDCIRRVIMWNCDSALGPRKCVNARNGIVSSSSGPVDDVTEARRRRQRITESIYNGGEFFAYDMSDMFATIQTTAFGYNKGEVSLEVLHEELLRMLHCYILPAIPITTDVLPLVQAAYSTQQQFVRIIDEEIVEKEQKLWRHDRARLRQLLKFVDSLNDAKSATLSSLPKSFIDVLHADIQKESLLAKESLEISQHVVEEAKKQHYQGRVDVTYVNNKRAIRDKDHEHHVALLQTGQVLQNHILRLKSQENSLTHSLKTKIKPRAETMDPIQATYHSLSEMARDMQKETIVLIEKKLLILSVKEAIRNTISELQVLGDTPGIHSSMASLSRSTDVLGSLSVASQWLTLEDRVSQLLDDTDHPITQKFNSFCAHLVDLCQATLSEKEKADWSLAMSVSLSETSSDQCRDLDLTTSHSTSFEDSVKVSHRGKDGKIKKRVKRKCRSKWYLGASDAYESATSPVRTSSVSKDLESMGSYPAFSPGDAQFLDSTRVQPSTSSELTSSGSSSSGGSVSNFMPYQSFYSSPTISVNSRDTDSTYSFVCYLDECPYACCSSADREVFILGDDETFTYDHSSHFICYLGDCDACRSIERSPVLLDNIPEICAQKECTEVDTNLSTLKAPIEEGTDVLSFTKTQRSASERVMSDADANVSQLEDSFASSGVFSQCSVNDGGCYLQAADLAHGSLLQLDDNEGRIGGSEWCDAIIIHDSEKNPIRDVIERLKNDIPRHLNKMTKRLSSEMECSTQEGFKRIRLRYECHFYQAVFGSLIQLYDKAYSCTCDQFRDCLPGLAFAELQLDSSLVTSMMCDGTITHHTEDQSTDDRTGRYGMPNVINEVSQPTSNEDKPMRFPGVIMRRDRGQSGRRKPVDSGLYSSEDAGPSHTSDSTVSTNERSSVDSLSEGESESMGRALPFDDCVAGKTPHSNTSKPSSHSDHQTSKSDNRKQTYYDGSVSVSSSVLSNKALANERCSHVLILDEAPHCVSEQFITQHASNSPPLVTEYYDQHHACSCIPDKQSREPQTVSLDSDTPTQRSSKQGSQTEDQTVLPGAEKSHMDDLTSSQRSSPGMSLLPKSLKDLQPALECIQSTIHERIPLLKLQHLTRCLREVSKLVSRLQTAGSDGACSDDLVDILSVLLWHEGDNCTPLLYTHIMFLVDFIPSFFINGPYNYSLVQFCVAFQFLQDRLVLMKNSRGETHP